MNHLRHILIGLALCPVMGSCIIFDSDEDEVQAAEIVATELGDMGNVSVCGDVMIGEVPSRKALDIANRRGTKTLISLMPVGAPEDDAIAAECRRMGIAFVPIGVDKESPTNKDVDRVIEALDRDDRGPVLMYCATGSHAMMFFAIYRATHDGVSVEAALEAARRGGMTPDQSQVVRAQVDRLRL